MNDSRKDLVEPILEARRGGLVKARKYLAGKGIASRSTLPRKVDGLLKAARSDAERARRLLKDWGKHGGRIMEKDEAAFFFCYDCQKPLSLGSMYCPQCGALAGDPHGR